MVYFGDARINSVSCPDLGFLQLLTSGTDYIDLTHFRLRGVVVATHGSANAAAVAEHTLMMILMLLRRYRELAFVIGHGDWREEGLVAQMRELRARKLGIVGLGRVGLRVAKLANCFGSEVRYNDVVEKRVHYSRVPLGDLLAWAEIVSLHVPLTPATTGLIDREAVSLLRNGSYLVNTSRGAVIDEDAVLQRLRSGHLAGVGLDVFESEPARRPLTSPRLNLIETPHRAGASRDNWDGRLDIALSNISRYFRGLPVEHRVA